MAHFWAERGFAVIQPTHASSRVGGLPEDAEGAPLFWRERVAEIRTVIDRLPEIEERAPAVFGRLDAWFSACAALKGPASSLGTVVKK